MSKIAIIIPSRLEAERLPNKPLKKINNKEMILHVYELARNSGVGEVFVASPNDEILKCIKNNGGEAIKLQINTKMELIGFLKFSQINLNLKQIT